MSDNPNAEIIMGLRALADWLEAHPALLASPPSVNVWEPDPSDVLRHLGGFRKVDMGQWLVLQRDFGGGVCLDVDFRREKVCAAKVVGTRHIPEKVIPAHDEEIIEWECLPLGVAASGAAR